MVVAEVIRVFGHCDKIHMGETGPNIQRVQGVLYLDEVQRWLDANHPGYTASHEQIGRLTIDRYVAERTDDELAQHAERMEAEWFASKRAKP